ncbi:MAG: DUF6807 family protein [Bacteroidota bacterium]
MQKSICLLLILGFSLFSCAPKLGINIQDDGVIFQEGKDTILVYQTGNKSYNGTYERSNYIHPLFSLDKQVLTEDFPADHLHHRGIFWAWHQLYVGEKRIGDGWEIKDFKWEVDQVESIVGEGASKCIKAKVLWKSPLWLDDNGVEKPLVTETTTLTVYPTQKNYRQIDFEIELVGMEPNMRIGGSEDPKGYGGFSPRIRLEAGMVFMGENGKVTPQNLPVLAGPWMDVSGPLGMSGATAGLTIFSHQSNPGFPNPWILRSKGSMQNAVYPYPGAEGIELSNVKPTVLKYRLLVHQGLSLDQISNLYTSYK